MNNAAAQSLNTEATERRLFALGFVQEGGFFVGIILLNGIKYGIAVAPKELGETEGSWGGHGKIIDAFDFADGMANTEAMLAAGSHIAKWARDLDINGHNDWYIPSRDELELIYRHLKPGEDETGGYFRDGENPSSVKPGQLYARNKPVQTTVDEFKTGGVQAMDETWYWSSTQSSAYDAFVQGFSDGYQSTTHKHGEWRVRAVRRFLIP